MASPTAYSKMELRLIIKILKIYSIAVGYMSSLMHAVTKGFPDVIEILLQRKANPDLVDIHGNTIYDLDSGI